jgi:hypothetical protein
MRSAYQAPIGVSAHPGNDPFRKSGNRNRLLRGAAPRARKGADRVSPSFLDKNFLFESCSLGDPPPGSAPLALATPVLAEGQVCMCKGNKPTNPRRRKAND